MPGGIENTMTISQQNQRNGGRRQPSASGKSNKQKNDMNQSNTIASGLDQQNDSNQVEGKFMPVQPGSKQSSKNPNGLHQRGQSEDR